MGRLLRFMPAATDFDIARPPEEPAHYSDKQRVKDSLIVACIFIAVMLAFMRITYAFYGGIIGFVCLIMIDIMFISARRAYGRLKKGV